MEKFVEETHGERDGEAKVEGLRAELLNCPHTLLQLPCIRERLHQMSFTDSQLYSPTQILHRLQNVYGMSGEEIFRQCDEVLNTAKSHSTARWKFLQRCVKDTTYYYLVGLDTLLGKLCKNPRWYDLFHRVISFSVVVDEYMKDVIREHIICDLSSSDLESDRDYEESTPYAMVVGAVVVLLLCVCQFLMLFVDRGRGSRSYSSGSLDFRDVYVSIVLFRGAYIWIKFRQAATSQTSLKRKSFEAHDRVPGVYPRAMKNKWGTITHYKYEPRFKPRREKLDSGATLLIPRLSLGEYDTPGEAKIVRQIAAFYYGAKDAGDRLALEDDSFFVIPAMDEPEKRLSGLSKAKWVADRAKELFKELHPKTGVKSRKQSRTSNASVELDVAGFLGSGHEPIPHNVPEMGNDAPEPYHHDNSSGHDGTEAITSASDQQMFDELGFGFADMSSLTHSIPGLGTVSEIFGDASPPQSDTAKVHEFAEISNSICAQGCESLGAVRDNCTVTNVCKPVKERDDQPQASGLKELLQKYAIRNADLEHQLFDAEVKNSELRRDNEQLRAGKWQADVMNSELQRVIEHLRAAKAQEAAEIDAYCVIDFPWENGR